MHLGFYVFFQNYFAVVQNLLDARAQLARFRIDDLELFLYAESESVLSSAGYPAERCVPDARFFGRACAIWTDRNHCSFHAGILLPVSPVCFAQFAIC